MRAEIKRIHSPDVDNLYDYSPDDPQSFSLLLQVIVGPEGEQGAESFDIEICTPKWLSENYRKTDVIIGRHYLIVFEYNFDRIMKTIASFVEKCAGANWHEIATKLGRLGKWEFEDYEDRKQ